MKKLLLIIPLFLFLLVSPALAVNKNSMSNERREVKIARLTEAKLKACQARETNISKQIDQLTKMSTNMLSVFDKISTRVKNYYLETAVPAGKTISNYSALVADVESNRADVTVALAKAQAPAADFSCEGDDPKGLLNTYRSGMTNVKTALKEYRSSINKLIVAVRTVSPTPTATPAAQ